MNKCWFDLYQPCITCVIFVYDLGGCITVLQHQNTSLNWSQPLLVVALELCQLLCTDAVLFCCISFINIDLRRVIATRSHQFQSCYLRAFKVLSSLKQQHLNESEGMLINTLINW